LSLVSFPFLVLSCTVLSCLVLPCLVSLVFSFLILSYLFVSCLSCHYLDIGSCLNFISLNLLYSRSLFAPRTSNSPSQLGLCQRSLSSTLYCTCLVL
jgi:hypothetical protein